MENDKVEKEQTNTSLESSLITTALKTCTEANNQLGLYTILLI